MGTQVSGKMESDKYSKQAKKSHDKPSAPELQKTLESRKKLLDAIK